LLNFFEEAMNYGILAQALLRKESSESWMVIKLFIYITKITIIINSTIYELS